MRSCGRHALIAFLALAGCVSFGPESGPPMGTYRERLGGFAGLLRMEDRHAYDPLLAGRAAASPDPWLRAKTALALGRLRDPAASIFVPVLLKDPDASVRRAAAFGAGLSGDARLVRFLVAAPARREGPRSAAGLALFRKPETPMVAALLGVFGEEDLAPELRRAVVYALARKPDPAAVSALRAVLRKGNNDPTVVSWAARAAGLLEDEESTGDLVRLATSRDVSVSVQTLTALNSLSKKSAFAKSDELARSARDVALLRANDPLPGVAIAALRLLGALPDSPASRATLEENLLRKGWRGQTALVALTRLDPARAPEAAAARLEAAQTTGSLELRLGAAQSLEFFEGDGPPEPVVTAAAADRSARVRAASLSSLSKKKSSRLSARLLAGLMDHDPAVRAVALEESAPLIGDAGGELLRAWNEAYGRSFAEKEPDFIVSALDAAAARKAGGREVVVGHANDADAVGREKARRLLVEKNGAAPGSFRPIPVSARLSTEDYSRVARAANESLFEAEIATTRGTFRVQLLAEDAPLTVASF